MISKALERNLLKQGIKIKPNFVILLSKFDTILEKMKVLEEEKSLIREEILLKIFIILNRSNSNRKNKDTSPITTIFSLKVLGLLDIEDISIIKNISGNEIFQSITGMQRQRGMMKNKDFIKMLELCTDDDGKLDKELLSSITGMQNC